MINGSFVLIRAGAKILMDMSVWRWPDVPYGYEKLVFNAKQEGDSDRYELTANMFGRTKAYGNGAISAVKHDLIFLQ